MKPIPPNAQIQKLIASHPDGVKGPPLAVAWSSHRPDTLVIIDTVGHKLIFPEMSLRGSEATAAISPTAPKEPNKKPPAKPAKPVGARLAPPASKSKSKPSKSPLPLGEGQGEGAGQGEGTP